MRHTRQQTAGRSQLAWRRVARARLAGACLLVSFFVGGAVAAQTRSSVRAAGEHIARGERITLGDLAEVSATDARVAERLRAIALGYAPNVGAVRELSRARVLLAIAAAGFAASEVEVIAPPVIFIQRAAQAVEPEVMRGAVERAMCVELCSGGVAARLVRLDLPAHVEVPSGVVEARAALGGARDLLAPFNVAIEIFVDGRVARRLNATAQIEARARVMVAARDIAAGARLREDDARSEMQVINRPVAGYLREAGQLRGMSVNRAVAQGEALTRQALNAEIVVRPGDQVRVTGETGAFSVAVAGEARAAGRVGDRIQVRNIQSGALLQAVVVDEGLVRVRL